METRLIAVDQLQGRLGGYGGEAVGEPGQLVPIGGLGRNGAIHDAGFDGPGAALAPEGGKHLLDQAQLDGIGGREARDELGLEGIKGLARFVFKDDYLGHEAVAGGVPGGTAFSGRGDRALGAGSIGSGRDCAS